MKLFTIKIFLILFLISCEEEAPAAPTNQENIYGCMDSNACNYNPGANIADQSCLYFEDSWCCDGIDNDGDGLVDSGDQDEQDGVCGGLCSGQSLDYPVEVNNGVDDDGDFSGLGYYIPKEDIT